MADPNAIQVVTACAQAFEQVGLPEGRFHLALAAMYLATAKKSNSAFAFFDALEQVANEADSGVPKHLKDGNRDSEGFGHGEGYLYPHAYRDHWVAQQYLPTSLQGKIFYQPSDQGYEAQIRLEVARRREAQLAAMLAAEEPESGDVLSFSPDDPARERWLQRTISNAGERLGLLRDRLLDAARVQRHSLVLDLKAGSGLLTWEALRRVPEGGVYALARSRRDADALRQLAERLPAVERPLVMEGTLAELPTFLALQLGGGQLAPRPWFDAIVGYNALFDEADKAGALHTLARLLKPDGVVSLAERVPRHTQRIYALVTATELEPALVDRWAAAEEAIYARPDDPLVNWDVSDLVALAEEAGFTTAFQVETETTATQISPTLLSRWFTPAEAGRPSYVDHLGKTLTPQEIAQIRALVDRQLRGQVVAWNGQILLLSLRRQG
jgi:putative ATPase